MTLLITGRLIRKDAWECHLHLASGLTITHVGATESGGKRCMRAAEHTALELASWQREPAH